MSWPELSLGVVCNVRRGTTITQTKARPGNIPVVAGGLSATYYHDTPNRLGKVITISASGANAGYVNFWSTPIFASDCSTVESDEEKVDIKFIFHFLRSKQEYINSKLRSGAAQPHVYAKDIAQLMVPLPPLSEQRRITTILDQADALRAKRRDALAQMDILTQSIFIEMFGDPVSNPRGWNQENLEHFFQFRTGKLDSNAAVVNGAYPFFTCAKEDSKIDTFAFDCEALLLAGNNATADYSVKHYKGKFNAYQRTYVITLKNPDNSYQYAAFFLENHLLELKRMSKGSGTKYLTLAMLNRIRIPVPPVDLQHQFVTRLAGLHRIREMFKKSLFDLDTLFTSLQYRAFRGEL